MENRSEKYNAALPSERIDTGYVRGVLDSTGRLASRGGAGYVTDYWRDVIKVLCDRVDELEADIKSKLCH